MAADPSDLPGPSAILWGDGEMGALVRAFDWASHPLGPTEGWSVSLRTMVQSLLANRFPIMLWWGPDYYCLYNDAYRPILGTKHPAALGAPVRSVWSEIWHVLQPLIDTPYGGGPSTWIEDFALELNRNGYLEETHFTVAYSPVPDPAAERGIGGVLATVHEITEKIIGERRLAVLSDLGGRLLVEAQTADSACRAAAAVIDQHPWDLPFALLYLIDPASRRPRLAASAGFADGAPLPMLEWDRSSRGLSRAIDDALRLNEPRVIEGIGSLFQPVPAGPWSEPPHTAVAIPIQSNLQHQHAGVLVAGVSRRIVLDERYLAFLGLVAAQIATAVASARAYEEEKRRAEALAELDRVKTAFFSNVSHEFRTPLTLMLGPLEEALRRVGDDMPVRQELVVAHRNALRLLKLVNTLLEFSRIEAGRVEATYERTDVAAFTAELASSFRSAIERAGLRLVIELPSDPVIAFLDRDMWEKVVLNLLSNAFKHTFEGHVRVVVREIHDAALLEVHDTGVGIAPDQLPRIFDRFHRVPNARGRAHEGTGIGLALVRELATLHGGSVQVASEEEKGSTFVVRVPLGSAHLPPDRVGAPRHGPPTGLGATPFVEEALRWLPETALGSAPGSAASGPKLGRILLADDNADMREYVARLLRAEGWRVDCVPDGMQALEWARHARPDLVLSDVMMPGLDGFELLKRLRSDPETSEIPVILLSARAAEEARVEGMERGADDYLIKPFSANELVARVGSHLRLSERRRALLGEERAARERAERAAAEAAEANRVKSDFLAVMSHELRTPLNAVGGYAQLLEMEIHGPLTDRQRLDLTRIHESHRHLLAMINKVLNYAKLDAGVEQYEIEDVPVQDVLEGCRVMTEPQLVARGIELVMMGCRDTGAVARADREKVQQVVLNLLSNAGKFTDPGGRVTLACKETTDRVLLAVGDTGRGILPDQLERIFQPFVQVERDRSRVREGTGLGLAISRELARGMGGDLVVESVPGEGSTFTLVLPRAGSDRG